MKNSLEELKSLDEKYVMQTYRRLPVAFKKGRGTRLWDIYGKEYLDFIAGLGACVLGHCHPRVTEAIFSQAERLIHTTNLFYIEPQVEVAKIIVDNTFPSKCFFCNSGAEANEGALKLARKYHYLLGKQRKKVICAFSSFHGRTLATLSATGQPSKWEPFEPRVEGFVHIPFNDIGALENAVDEETAAVMLEPIQGEGGVNPATADFLKAARKLTECVGALLIFDEVQTGLGRTGALFAYKNFGVVPDIMTLAKGLANGVPMGAFIATPRVVSAFEFGDHGSTFGGNHLACATSKATLETIVSEDLPSNARRIGNFLFKGLRGIMKECKLVRDVRGMGLMLAIEFEKPVAKDVVYKCLEKGLILNDVTEKTVRLLPPLVLNEEDASTGLSILAETIKELR